MTTNKNIVDIHGKKYLTVAGRVEAAHDDLKEGLTISTEMIRATDKGIMFKATITTPKGQFTGHSYASLSAAGITGQSPIEVAETSAIGRALGFAGYGIVEGMATADEVKKSESGISKVDSSLDRCTECNKAVPQAVYKFSTERYGKALCYDCQKTVNDVKEVKQSGLLEPAESAESMVAEDLPF